MKKTASSRWYLSYRHNDMFSNNEVNFARLNARQPSPTLKLEIFAWPGGKVQFQEAEDGRGSRNFRVQEDERGNLIWTGEVGTRLCPLVDRTTVSVFCPCRTPLVANEQHYSTNWATIRWQLSLLAVHGKRQGRWCRGSKDSVRTSSICREPGGLV